MSTSYYERIETEKLARQQWLSSLQVGDEVALPRADLIAVVTRLTPKQIIIGQAPRESRFDAGTGYSIGGSAFTTLQPVTDDLRQRIKIKANRARIKMEAYQSDRLTDDEITVMLEALDKHRASTKVAPGGES